MDLGPLAHQDYRHLLNPGEHEALIFIFTSSDGGVSGMVRALLSRDSMMEIVLLRVGERAWPYHRRVDSSPASELAREISGDCLTLTCLDPWQNWRICFEGVSQVGQAENVPLRLDLTFRATDPAGYYHLGPYQQGQQDGRLSGTIQVGSERWQDELICWRDHSWGRRQQVSAFHGWTMLIIPERLCMSIIRPPENRTFGIGRIMTSEGQFSPVVAPRVTFCEQGGQVEDPEAGLPAWAFRRLASPTISYVDGAGLDTIRDRPEPGDVLQDELGPALFTSPIGEQVTGFWEECKRVTDSISAAGTAGTIDRLE